jgi:hypothetical protein
MIEEALVELGATVTERWYPLVLPDRPTLPAVVYQRISPRRDQDHGGPSGAASPRFQFSCWAESYAAARAMRADLQSVFLGFRGTVGGVRITGILDAGAEFDDFEPVTGRWRCVTDMYVGHVESGEGS